MINLVKSNPPTRRLVSDSFKVAEVPKIDLRKRMIRK